MVRVQDAIAHVDQALGALGQIPKTGDLSMTVDGIEHERRELAERLRSLHDDAAREADGAE